jgi:hypothetical protein
MDSEQRPTWQLRLDGAQPESVAQQAELFGRHEYTERRRPAPVDPDQPDLPGLDAGR